MNGGQYSTRLYLWAKQYVVVGHKRVSVATLRKVLGLEELRMTRRRGEFYNHVRLFH